ncbi:MAG TPA: glycine oxidase ThiO [Thermoanaerobaculia bacterium]|nr:glycine oxidase ThiO [Thermoanaerobaculia bacterium]
MVKAAKPDVVVLGAGLIGLAVARELLKAGLSVEVVDRGKPGHGASNAAAGMLSPLAEATESGPFFDACRASRDLWLAWHSELGEESGVTVDYDDSGSLLVALSAGEEESLERLEALARQVGEPASPLPCSEARRRVPGLTDAIRQTLLLAGEHRVDNVQALSALVRIVHRLGGTLCSGVEVESVEASAGGVRLIGSDWQQETARLVLAAGAWSGEIPGLPALPVRPVRGQMIRVGGAAWEFRGILRSPHFYAVRRGPSSLLVGSTVEEAGFDDRTTLGGLARLFEFAVKALPRLADRPLEGTWAGLRPGTPDGLPLLGRLGDLPVWAATGHYRNGILLAPWTGRAVAAMLTGGEVPAEAAAFRPDRF